MTGLANSGEHLVVVVAHPDDESFGCGSLIALAVSMGARVTVICATRGEAGERVPDAATDHLPLGVLREHELRDAARVLEVAAVELLDLADSGFDGPLPENALCGVAVDQLADEIGSRLARLGADLVVILDGSDGHRDHRHIRSAVEAVTARGELTPRVVQSCIANSLMRRWIDELRVLDPDAAYLELDVDTLGQPDVALTAIDVSAQLRKREAAIACHRSQQSPFDRLSPELRAAFLSTDYIVVSDSTRQEQLHPH